MCLFIRLFSRLVPALIFGRRRRGRGRSTWSTSTKGARCLSWNVGDTPLSAPPPAGVKAVPGKVADGGWLSTNKYTNLQKFVGIVAKSYKQAFDVHVELSYRAERKIVHALDEIHFYLFIFICGGWHFFFFNFYSASIVGRAQRHCV